MPFSQLNQAQMEDRIDHIASVAQHFCRVISALEMLLSQTIQATHQQKTSKGTDPACKLFTTMRVIRVLKGGKYIAGFKLKQRMIILMLFQKMDIIAHQSFR